MQNLTLSAEVATDNSAGRIRWRYTASWDPPTEYNCAGLDPANPYSILISNESVINHGVNSYAFWIDSEEEVSVSIWARNDQSMESDITSVSEKSLLLRKSSFLSNMLCLIQLISAGLQK